MAQSVNRAKDDEGADGALTGQRLAFAELLAGGSTVKAAAEQLSLSKRTGYRWADDPAIKAAVMAAQREHMDVALRALSRSARSAVVALVRNVSATAAPSVQVRAAMAILDSLLKLRQATEIEDRIAALEEQAGVQR
jgi:hypothetical protein